MENKNSKVQSQSKYVGMSADEVFAQAVGNVKSVKSVESTKSVEKIQKPAPPTTPPPLVVQTPSSEAIQEIAAKLRGPKEKQLTEEANKATMETLARLEAAPTVPIQSIMVKDATSLIKVNELFTRHIPETATFNINNHAIIITLNGSYDSLVQAIGLATNLVIDSGDNYIFSPNQTIIGTLVFLREVTNLNLEFLIRPEIRISQLIETYDILMPLIQYIETIDNEKFQTYRGWYNRELAVSINAAITYQNSAKGIVDALAAHNIKDQKTMTEQMAELDSTKLSNIIDFMAKVEPKKE